MKERLRPPFRNILVCYKGNTCISWRNEAEFKVIFDAGEVNWYEIKTKKGYVIFNEADVKKQYEERRKTT